MSKLDFLRTAGESFQLSESTAGDFMPHLRAIVCLCWLFLGPKVYLL